VTRTLHNQRDCVHHQMVKEAIRPCHTWEHKCPAGLNTIACECLSAQRERQWRTIDASQTSGSLGPEEVSRCTSEQSTAVLVLHGRFQGVPAAEHLQVRQLQLDHRVMQLHTHEQHLDLKLPQAIEAMDATSA
jgi:hypothetical protein